MILLSPTKMLVGSYGFCARNNEAPEVFLYDKECRLYRLDEGLTLHEAGCIYNHAKLHFNTISFHPFMERAAFMMEEDALGVGDFAGQLLWSKVGEFACVLFSRDGKLIWTAQKLDENRLQILVYRSEDGTLVHAHEMEDPLCDSTLRMMDIPASDSVTLELAAGQDGVSVYELSIQGNKLCIQDMFPNRCYITPAWHPGGRKLFTLENDMCLFACFSYPGLELSKEQLEEDHDYEDSDMNPGYEMLYLKNGLTVTQNMNNRFFLFDPSQMEQIDELAFAGYEPVPTNKVFPRLEEDTSPYSQISSFERVGKLFIAKTGSLHETQHVLIIEEAAVVEAISLHLHRLS
ncbi:hypothetical protein [Paenibacillus sp. GCM10027626]|uniref:hypothetical protein n=1 Tax=Paenibacillus sp. GCM10027626 TaxID=3273411 RepID=UPI00363F4B07